MGFSSDSGSSLKGATFGILEYFVGAHSLNILSRLESLSGGPSGGGYLLAVEAPWKDGNGSSQPPSWPFDMGPRLYLVLWKVGSP